MSPENSPPEVAVENTMSDPEQNELTAAETPPSNSPPGSGPGESTLPPETDTPPCDNDTTAKADTKVDDSGENSAADDKGAHSKEAEQGSENVSRQRVRAATLFCPRNGDPHSNLLSFGIISCPACSQSLVRAGPLPPIPPPPRYIAPSFRPAYPRPPSFRPGPPPPFGYPRPPSFRPGPPPPPQSFRLGSLPPSSSDGDSNSDGSSDDVEESEVEPNLTPAHLKVDHDIEYRDLNDNCIMVERWGRRFQLERERNRALKIGSAGKKESVFRTVTVLQTSLPNLAHRPGGVEHLRENCSIGNPQISIAVQFTKIVILSGLFIDALKSVVSYDTQNKLKSSELHLDEPFSVITHHLDELEDYVRRADDGTSITKTAGSDAENKANSVERETRLHVGLVLDFVKTILKDTIDQERARYKQDVPVCTYRMIWYLIRPGDIVYDMSDEGEDAYVVDSVEMEQFSLSTADIDVVCTIKVWYLDFNGESITRARHEIDISPFKGERPITSLEVVPCKYWDKKDGGKLRASLEARGAKWVEHLLGKQVDYRDEPFKPGKQRLDGRAYTDPASFYDSTGSKHEFQRYLRKGSPETDYDNLSLKNVGVFVDDLGRRIGHLLCCREVKGFVFHTRNWETLDIRYCQPVKPDKNPFARLVMPTDRKLMIKALVYKYTDPKYAGNVSQVWGADFIRNKGEGLIFLLHGGPGVGKTFTAECIAEFTGRPLLALTSGDVGTDEVQMEKKLRYWLRLAYQWGAVMLIDEADVFLEKRQDSDLKRNSLVSVFLREIEYYRGILFLTSNRVGKFDDAIVSRIHVVIHYKGLDDEYRKKIWNQFFDKLGNERGSTIKIEPSARRYVLENKKMTEMKWNGREIRNAFQTAVALAEYRFLTKPETEKEDGEIAVLEEEDFKEICDMTIKFKEYLNQVNEGQDEETRALLDRSRVAE